MMDRAGKEWWKAHTTSEGITVDTAQVIFVGLDMAPVEAARKNDVRHAIVMASILLLIGFGLAYAVWGLKNMRAHRHEEIDPKKSFVVWSLIVIFVLGPCEPLIPLMFVAAASGWGAVLTVALVFSVVTIVMMLAQTWLVFRGIDLFSFAKKINHHHGHIVAGLVIALTGASVMFLGI